MTTRICNTLVLTLALGIYPVVGAAQDVAPDETPAMDAEVQASGTMGAAVGADTGATDGGNPLDGRAIVLGLKLGGGFGAFSDFGAAFVSELEVGVLVIPGLEIFVSGMYAAPRADGSSSEPDMRLAGGGTFNYKVTQQEFALTLGALYRAPLTMGSMTLLPYGAIGPRAYMMTTKVEADVGGEAFGENKETMMQIGLYVAGGLDVVLGPGALFGELQVAYAGLNRYVMRSTNVGSMNLAIGYRVFL